MGINGEMITRARKRKLTSDVKEPLKPLKRILEPDPRQPGIFGVKLEERHAELKRIKLHGDVPVTVRQLFETAKNVALYSWFAYPLHGVAELMGCMALHWALKERVAAEQRISADSVRKEFRDLLTLARDRGWIKNDGFSYNRLVALHKLRQSAIDRRLKRGMVGKRAYAVRITKAQVIAQARELDFISKVIQWVRTAESDFVHGRLLFDKTGSLSTLNLVSEAINPMFPVSAQSR